MPAARALWVVVGYWLPALCVLAVVILADTLNMQAVWLDHKVFGVSLAFVRGAPWDKLAHVTGIALLVILIARAWRASIRGGRPDPTWWVATAVVAFCAASEWYQAQTLPGHEAVPHFAADFGGVMIAAALMMATRRGVVHRAYSRPYDKG